MEKFEEKIIDLVDVIAEPEPALRKEVTEPTVPVEKTELSPEIEPDDMETLIRNEVDRLVRSKFDEKIDRMIREILLQEIEKAIAREIESLKRS